MRDNDIPIKFIMLLAGGALAFILIGFLFNAVNSASDKGEEILSQSNEATNAMIQKSITKYNKDDISGDNVLHAIEEFMNTNEEIYVEVKTKKGTTTYIYPSKKLSDDDRQTNEEIMDALKKAKDKSDNTYISPKGSFDGKVVYDNDDDSIIVGLYFEQK